VFRCQDLAPRFADTRNLAPETKNPQTRPWLSSPGHCSQSQSILKSIFLYHIIDLKTLGIWHNAPKIKQSLALPHRFQVEQLAKTSVGDTETFGDLTGKGKTMKAIAFNGSARKDGNTAIMTRWVFDELEKE